METAQRVMFFCSGRVKTRATFQGYTSTGANWSYMFYMFYSLMTLLRNWLQWGFNWGFFS